MAPFKGAVKKVKSREWTGRYVGGYTLLAIAVFLVAIALLLPSDLLANYLRSMLMSKPLSAAVGTLQEASIDILQAEKEAPNKPQENLSAYDEYVALSIANGWSPTDPVLKLESTIRKYSQLFDVLDKKALEESALLKQYLDMMGQEVRHLLKVLCKSADRTINLTPALHHALDVVQEIVYRLLKLHLGSSQMVYKTALTANLNHWMYSPLQELTKVAAKKYPHLKFNFNSRASAAAIGQDISSALEKATKRGLYNLLPMLLVFGADAASVMEALRISIRHGDDTALSLLLMSVVDPASSGTHSAPHLMHIRTSLLEKLPELIELAESLRFPHVLMRLHRIRQLFSSTGPDEGAAALSNLKSLERFNDYAPSEYVSSACGVTQRRDGSESGAGVSSSSSLLAGDGNTHGSRGLATAASGYDPFQIVDVFHQADAVSEVGADEEGETYELRSGPAGYRRCVVDRVDMSNITAELFFEKYVRLNQPVVLTATGAGDGGAGAVGASSTSTAAAVTGAAVAEGWDLSALLDRFGDIKEVAGDIPYATLFGHTEEITTLKEYVTSVMRPHTLHMRRQLSAEATGNSSSDVCSVGGTLDISYSVSEKYLTGLAGAVPGYIFSGVQQNLNKAVRKQMTQSVLHFTPPPSTSGGDGADAGARLMDLMHSVSVEYQPVFPTADTAASDTQQQQPQNRQQKRSKRKGKTSFKPHWKSQFYLGPALSGAPFHHHGPAFNMLVHGRKEWTIMPPGRDVYSSAHPIVWLRDGGLQAPYYPYRTDTTAGDEPCKIVQNPGEVIFVPRHWTHQVLNLAESVGFAVEIDDYVH